MRLTDMLCGDTVAAESLTRGHAMAVAKKIHDYMEQGSWIRKIFEEGISSQPEVRGGRSVRPVAGKPRHRTAG